MYAEQTAEHSLPCQMNDVNSKAVIAHILCPIEFMPLRSSLVQRLTATRQATTDRQTEKLIKSDKNYSTTSRANIRPSPLRPIFSEMIEPIIAFQRWNNCIMEYW